jgi:hypothetical protein
MLLETIKRVGVQNYSLLARLTGLNAETIRYKVNRHLTKLGLATTININYGELGLSFGHEYQFCFQNSIHLLFFAKSSQTGGFRRLWGEG